MTARLVDTGYRPHVHQVEIHARLKRFSVLVCHRRFGKTVLAINALVDAALRCSRTAGRFGYVAPYLKQAKAIAWLYLCQYALAVPGARKSDGELWIEMPNGARVTLYGADNAEGLRGLYLDGVVLDEVADMRPNVWGEIVRPALADRKGWCLFIGTPKGLNLFHELYQQALTDPSWYAGLYRADETRLPWLDDEELALARASQSEAQYRQEWLCDFSAATDNTLITIDMASDASRRMVHPADVAGAPLVMGVDVARYGDDRSVIVTRQGLIAHEPEVFRGVDNMTLAAHVADRIQRHRPDAVFVDAGRGEGVIDRLRQLGHAVIEVNFGGSPTSGRYANKRAEMWDSMAEWLRAGAMLPANTELKTDLCVPTFKMNRADKFELESKDDIKKRGQKSPDLADALALTFAMPVAPRTAFGQRQSMSMVSDYDPFA